MMKKLFATSLFASALLLAGCTSETDFEPAAPAPVTTPEEAVITINGGRPSGSLGATRTVNPPSLPGVCKADKMQIWAYTDHHNLTSSWQPITNLTTFTELGTIDVVNTKQTAEGSIDRWTKQSFSYDFPRTGCDYFEMPALAYTDADKDMFTYTKGANYTLAYLTLTQTTLPTPELFYGHTRFMPQGKLESYFGTTDGDNYWNNSGYFSYKNNGTLIAGDPTSFTNLPLRGDLYRIVSQINVAITEVPVTIIDHLELYMTNVPKKLVLYGTHGAYYHVTAASSASDCIDGNTLVATTNDFTNGEAHLSAFFLPSEVGGELTLRVHYKADAVKDAEGHDVLLHDYPIQPGNSAFLTGDDADVYNAPALQNGSDLYVYHSTSHKFYSYSNVRVNINGKYENVATEDQDVTITLEVEPGYEREHTITIN